jgi:hypothetical protein
MGVTSVLIQHRCVGPTTVRVLTLASGESGTRFLPRSQARGSRWLSESLDHTPWTTCSMDNPLERCPMLNSIHGFRTRTYRKGLDGNFRYIRACAQWRREVGDGALEVILNPGSAPSGTCMTVISVDIEHYHSMQ